MQGLPIAYFITDKSNIIYQTPYDISKKLETFDQLLEFCRTVIDKSKILSSPQFNENFKRMIHIDEQKFSSEIIAEDLIKLKTKNESSYKASFKVKTLIFLRELKYWIKSYLTLKKNIGIAPPEIKMPGGITKGEIDTFLTRFDKNSEFKLREVFKNCIEIEK